MTTDHPVVILAPRITDDSVAIWRTCLDLGWSSVRIQGWRVPDELLSHSGDFILFGEPLFAEAVCDQLGLVLLEPAIDWLTTVPREHLSREIEIMTLGDARNRATRAFVKPADGKIFEPKVYDTGADLPSEEHVDASIFVLRSGIMDFRLEVRCFVAEREIVTMSPYWRNDELAFDAAGNWPFFPGEEEATRVFASKVLADPKVTLPPACTLDVGLEAGGTWAVIEANPCWGAGLYGCDPAAVLKAIRVAIRKRSEIAAADLPWISKRRREIHGSE